MSILAVPDGSRGDGTIKDGDLVIVYESHDHMKAVRVTLNGSLQNRFGLFKHSDWIGIHFGSKVVSNNGRGFVYLLAPSPELWTLVLPHRTQILYVADIALVVSFLELTPGSTVVETGTGSGSMTHSLARAVAPTGHVHSFEYHEERAEKARAEFEQNGLLPVVTLKVRDIQGEGFPADLEGTADGVFLDLPGPWTVIPSAAHILKPHAPLCSFSPCMEQVQKTAEALRLAGFTGGARGRGGAEEGRGRGLTLALSDVVGADVRTFEILLRAYEVRHEQLATDLMGEEGGRKRQQSQEEGERKEGEGGGDEGMPGAEGKADIEEVGKGGEDESEGGREGGGGRGKKRGREELWKWRETAQAMANPVAETKGHTGYLTFGRRAV